MSERDELDEAIDAFGVDEVERFLRIGFEDERACFSLSYRVLFADPAETRRRCSQRKHSSEAVELLREADHILFKLELKIGHLPIRNAIQSLLHKVESET